MPNDQIRSLLLIDADAAERRRISAIASRAGWTVVGADGPETATAILRGPYGPEVKVALLGHWDPNGGGALIDALRDCHFALPVLVLTEGAVPAAVDAIRAGATDFLSRPVAPERLLEALAVAADRRRPSGELTPIAEKFAPELPLDQMVGSTPDFRSSLAVAAKAARNRLPILRSLEQLLRRAWCHHHNQRAATVGPRLALEILCEARRRWQRCERNEMTASRFLPDFQGG